MALERQTKTATTQALTRRQLIADRHDSAPRQGKRFGWRRRGPPGGLDPGIERKIGLARLALTWERLWPLLWPSAALISAFLAVSLLDLWGWMPGWLHAAALAAFAAALLAAVITAARAFEPPVRAQAARRVERLNHLAHRPLSTLKDDPSGHPGRTGRVLWAVHQARLRERLGALRVGWPSPQLLRHDPYGLRAAIALVLILGFMAAGADWPDRLTRAFTPGFAEARDKVTLEAWITPPDYTGVAPIFLRPGPTGGDPVTVPAASRFTARVHNPAKPPRLGLGDQWRDFEAVDNGKAGDDRDFEIELDLDQGAVPRQGTVLRVAAGGRTLATWPIEIVADAPPVIGFTAPPVPTLRKALKVTYEATDDYGIERAVLRLVLIKAGNGGDEDDLSEDEGDDREDGDALDLPLPGTGGGPRQVAATAYHDLTAHPWAGMNARATLVAWDALGQPGESPPVTLRLPERVFSNPVARELVAARKKLFRNPRAAGAVAGQLDALARQPDRFADDDVVFMGLRVIYWRLMGEPNQADRHGVTNLLWDLALRVEDGDMLLAERDLRAAIEALEAALENHAPPEEIERLTDQVQAALGRYLRALADQARDRKLAQSPAPNGASQMIGSDTFRQMLEQLRALNRLGARGAAKDLLANLRNILENLRTDPGGAAQGARTQALSEALHGIDQVMRDQQEVIERTENVAVDRGRGQSEDGARSRADEVGRRQEAVRRKLGEAMADLGRSGARIPGAIDRADNAMADAGQALGRGNLGTALQHESAALEELQDGAGEIAKALAQAAAGGSPGLGGPTVDPLGRSLGNAESGDDGIIPRRMETRRAQKILEELRRRANQQHRPRQERDYIERLLKRF